MLRAFCCALLLLCAGISLESCASGGGRAPVGTYAGTLQIAIRSSGGTLRQSAAIAQTMAASSAGFTVHERDAWNSGAASADWKVYPTGYSAQDSSGVQTAARYDPRKSTIVETIPKAIQVNRTVRSDGSYREVADVFVRGASVASTMTALPDGHGSWQIDVFPHSTESSSTYYGFLNDAQVRYDFSAEPTAGIFVASGDGGYARGYAAKPPLRRLGAVKAWYDVSAGTYTRTYRVRSVPLDAVPCGALKMPQRPAVDEAEERIRFEDPMAGTMESVNTQSYSAGQAAPLCIRVTEDFADHYASLLSRSRGNEAENITVSEVLALQANGSGIPAPDAVGAFVREQVRRIVRVQIERDRAALIRSLIASGH